MKKCAWLILICIYACSSFGTGRDFLRNNLLPVTNLEYSNDGLASQDIDQLAVSHFHFSGYRTLPCAPEDKPVNLKIKQEIPPATFLVFQQRANTSLALYKLYAAFLV